MAVYLRFPEGKPKTLTFSYDDGVDQDKRLSEDYTGQINRHKILHFITILSKL